MIELLPPDQWHKLDAIFAEEFKSAIPDPKHAYIIADVEDSELKGFIVVESLVWVGQIYVMPRYRGDGATQRLIKYVEDKSRKTFRSVIAIASEPRFERLFERKRMRKISGTLYRKEMY